MLSSLLSSQSPEKGQIETTDFSSHAEILTRINIAGLDHIVTQKNVHELWSEETCCGIEEGVYLKMSTKWTKISLC